MAADVGHRFDSIETLNLMKKAAMCAIDILFCYFKFCDVSFSLKCFDIFYIQRKLYFKRI